MIRGVHTWLLFGLCLGIVFAAMGWISVTVIRLERAELAARRQAALEENVRLALWRMESAIAPIVAEESGRPYFAYSAFYPAQRTYTRMFAEIRRGEILVPSELLTFQSPHVALHFHYSPDGTLTSPQVPVGNMRDLAEARYVSGERVEEKAALLEDLRARLSPHKLLSALPPEPVATARAWGRFPDPPEEPQKAPAQQESARGEQEFQARFDVAQRAVSANVQVAPAPVDEVSEGPLQSLWLEGELFLARRVRVNGSDYAQGCWLDWPAIKDWFLGSIEDLLPAADLQAAPRNFPQGAGERMLAALPVTLLAGETPTGSAPFPSPIFVTLVIAWSCIVVGATAVGALLVGTVRLSERRAAFVSAVTHELRTPLTTFHMYTEMLAEGMVCDPEKRRQYLGTLCDETARLTHLVENVLAYSRLERGRAGGRVQTMALRDLVDAARQRLARRAERAGMELSVEGSGEALVRADISVVEQILFNLVDNACKYAVSGRVIRLEMDADGDYGLLRVRDFGPGVRRRGLFKPFSKSARDAAGGAPGVGLGLALSRRLAHSMGGRLRLERDAGQGACFALSLRRARRDDAPHADA